MFTEPDVDILLSGKSKVCLYTNIMTFHKSHKFFLALMAETEWKSKTLKLFGKIQKIPRLSAWYGDLPYTYSGIKMMPNPLSLNLLKLKKISEVITGAQFNSVLVNLYRNGQDSIGWHSDNEPELKINPSIASISLGGPRILEFRNKENKKKVSVMLPNNSLLFMSGETQHSWQHAIPKTKRFVRPRINLTFRQIYHQHE